MKQDGIVIKVKKSSVKTVTRSCSGDGILRCDSSAAGILDTYLERYPGVSIKDLVSGIIKYVGEGATVVEEK